MKSISFTRGEYWLIEAVVTYRIPVCLLFEKDIDIALNKPGHGMNRRETERALKSLQSRNLIELVGKNDDALDSVDAALEKPRAACYGLTPEGGKEWEAFAAPNWDHYFDYKSSFDNELEKVEICSQNHERLKQYFNGLHHDELFPVSGTVEWSILEPWQATYWKLLPRGFHIGFDATREEFISWDAMPLSYYNLTRPRWYQWG